MAFLFVGTRPAGGAERYGGEYAYTRFFHVMMIPLVPRGSFWVTHDDRRGNREGHEIRLHHRSVALAYLEGWPWIAALAIAAALRGPIGWVLAALTLLVPIALFFALSSVRGDAARRRSDFNLAAFGTRCEPERMTLEMRSRLQETLRARWDALDRDHSPSDVARHGTDDVHEAVIAYGLLRLIGARDSRAGAAARADALRLVDGMRDAVPTGSGPYRAGATPDDRPAPVAASQVSSLASQVAAERDARVAPKPPLWLFRPRMQLAGLCVLTVLGAVGLAVSIARLTRAPSRLGAPELQQHPMYAGERVAIHCDRVAGTVWTLHAPAHPDDVTARVIGCELGDRLLLIAAGPDGLEGDDVVGDLRAIEDPTHPPVWAQGLRSKPELAARTYDHYVDTYAATHERAKAIKSAISVVPVSIAWFFWLRAWRRRRRQTRAAA